MAKLSCWLGAALICGSWATATAQNAISAKAGLVQVADGDVFVNDKPIQTKIAEFTDLKNADVLRTVEGRTEVLLTPGSFVRMGDNSSLRMVSSRLSDVRLEMLQGEALVEITEMLSDNGITVTLGSANFQLAKGGIFRFDADPARLRVYKGEANALLGEKIERVREGRQLTFNGNDWTQSGFDTKDTDALYRWSQRRAENIAVANVSAARQSGNSFDSTSYPGYGATGYGWGGYGYNGLAYGGFGYGGYNLFGGNWMYNPFFGMYTFLPFDGTAWSPFGYAFYTPITVIPVYVNAPIQQPPAKPGVPGKPGKTLAATGSGVRTPAFTSAAALHTGTVTRGLVATHSWSGGGPGYSGYSTGSSGNASTRSVSPSAFSTATGSAHAGATGGGHTGK
jgi:hypothetical protein